MGRPTITKSGQRKAVACSNGYSTNLTESNAASTISRTLQLLPPLPTGFCDRGIVIPCGGLRYFTCAWVCINILRHLGCHLPIEVWHIGVDEMSNKMRELLKPLDVVIVDALEVCNLNPVRRLQGWELKPYAIIHSRFREVLFLDADQVPVVDPTFLFDTPQYRSTGSVFWPDFNCFEPHNRIWSLTGVPYRHEPEFETGQIVVDKERSWKPLMLTLWMNEYSDFWYRYVHGDKDTFHMAWRRLNVPYSMPEHRVHALSGVMCQHDFEGRRIFQHRNRAKWTLGNNPHIEGVLLEEECWKYIDELRQRWHPLEEVAGELNDEDRVNMQQLINERFRYVRVGCGAKDMLLGDGGIISEGSDAAEAYWWVKEGTLIIARDNGAINCRLRPVVAGMWYGVSEDGACIPVQLEPLVK